MLLLTFDVDLRNVFMEVTRKADFDLTIDPDYAFRVVVARYETKCSVRRCLSDALVPILLSWRR